MERSGTVTGLTGAKTEETQEAKEPWQALIRARHTLRPGKRPALSQAATPGPLRRL